MLCSAFDDSLHRAESTTTLPWEAGDMTDTNLDEAMARLDAGLGVLSGWAGAPDGLREQGFADLLRRLMALVLEGNEKVNLTTITDPVEFVELQLLDSLACVGLPWMARARNVVDIGSGAGFPGLPLALLYPEKRFLLTDALNKRTEFVKHAVGELGLRNVEAVHSRAETAGQDPRYREAFDLAVCRAVGKMPVILEYALPFVRVGGQFFAYKTVRAEGEIADSLLARRQLGGSSVIETFQYVDLLPKRAHAIYVVGKERRTPKKYPRREGLPDKVPL
jgi:16S rRNA (guanine527-N7)-methyltransferase